MYHVVDVMLWCLSRAVGFLFHCPDLWLIVVRQLCHLLCHPDEEMMASAFPQCRLDGEAYRAVTNSRSLRGLIHLVGRVF